MTLVWWVGNCGQCPRVLISWLLWWSPSEQDRQRLAPGSYDGHKETHSLHLVTQLEIFFNPPSKARARGVIPNLLNSSIQRQLFQRGGLIHLLANIYFMLLIFMLYKLICHLPVTGKHYPLYFFVRSDICTACWRWSCEWGSVQCMPVVSCCHHTPHTPPAACYMLSANTACLISISIVFKNLSTIKIEMSLNTLLKSLSLKINP